MVPKFVPYIMNSPPITGDSGEKLVITGSIELLSGITATGAAFAFAKNAGFERPFFVFTLTSPS